MLHLTHTALHKLKVHAMRSSPEECCGMVLGTEAGDTRRACDILEAHNAGIELRERRYHILPEEYRRAEAFAARHGVQILGLYHSHPNHPAEPSLLDLEYALPWFSYIIVAVEKGIPSAVRSWRLREDRSHFDEERLETILGECVHG
ncbi:MAG: hypothetical protein C4326_08860 [Ignavibacteria bacterium]